MEDPMNEAGAHLGFLRDLTWIHVALVGGVLIGGSLLVQLIRWIVRRAAESAPSQHRLMILRAAPIARLLIGISSLAIIIPLPAEPTFQDVIALIATVGLPLAFPVKAYVSGLFAGVVAIM